MNDVAENTFSKFEDDIKLKVRVDMPNNKPSAQWDFENFQVYANRNHMKVSNEKYRFCTAAK